MIFKNRKQIKNESLSAQLKELKSNNITCINKITALEEGQAKIIQNATELEKERDELKKMVREQTNADLLINALKSVGIINVVRQPNYREVDKKLRSLQAKADMMRLPPIIPFRAPRGIFGQ